MNGQGARSICCITPDMVAEKAIQIEYLKVLNQVRVLLQAGLLELAANAAATASATAETAVACLRRDKNVAFNASSNALAEAQVGGPDCLEASIPGIHLIAHICIVIVFHESNLFIA